MATNIPPHNLGEIVDACLALLDDPDISDDALLDIVPGPDFPTGGEIIGRTGAAQGADDRPRLGHHARQGLDRDDPQGPRGHHRHRAAVSR